MTMNTAWGATHLERNEIFSAMIKEQYRDETFAKSWVRNITELPDGNNLKINSFGELPIDEAGEGLDLPTRRMDTGQYVFNIDQYKGVKVSFTDELFEDSFMAGEALSRAPREMMHAFDMAYETEVLAIPNKNGGQIIDNSNVINGGQHRFVASGANRTLSLQDFAYAKYVLKRAKVPMTGLIAVVDPSTEFNFDVTANLVDLSYNPQWQGIVETGIGTGTRFVRNVYGFDVYTSEFLDEYVSGETNLTDRKGNAAAPQAGDKLAIFFSMGGGDSMPFIGAIRRTPNITSWREDRIRTEFHRMDTRYGLALYRPENLVCVWHSTALAD